MMALIVPAIILVGALVLSSRSSTTRRMASSVWTAYVAQELADSALSEAAHFLALPAVIPQAILDRIPLEPRATFVTRLMTAMVEGKFPVSRDYLLETRQINGKKALVGFQFLTRRPIEIKDRTKLTRRIAAMNPGLTLGPESIRVWAYPLSFHREFYVLGGHRAWVNWGVVQFCVQVRLDEFRKDDVLHELWVDRRFSLLRPGLAKGGECVRISTRNLRTVALQRD